MKTNFASRRSVHVGWTDMSHATERTRTGFSFSRGADWTSHVRRRHMTPYSPLGYMQRSIQRSQKARAEFARKNGVMCKHPAQRRSRRPLFGPNPPRLPRCANSAPIPPASVSQPGLSQSKTRHDGPVSLPEPSEHASAENIAIPHAPLFMIKWPKAPCVSVSA